MRLHACFALACAIALFGSACSGTGGSNDPRCASLCTIHQPSTPNAGDVCSQASADACSQACSAHVAGTTTACGDCLLQGASFGGTSGSNGAGCMSPSVKCPGASECTETGPGGTCTYCDNDPTAQQNCHVQTHPRRQVECPVDFRDPAKCSALCAAK